MKLWLDAQLPPSLANWLVDTFSIDAQAVRELGLRDASDPNIFEAARDAGVVVVTKDSDFVELVDRLGPPPQVLWVSCGNTSNARLKQILVRCLPQAIIMLEQGEPIIEINEVI